MSQKKKKSGVGELFHNRQKCNCVAQKHELIGNCINCGNIVCAREGQGPCLSCGFIVTIHNGTYIEMDENIFPTLPKKQRIEIELQRSKAILHRNELIERDRSKNGTQNIIDEQMDYYDISENTWLDEQKRKAALNRILQNDKYVEQQTNKITISYDPFTKQLIRQKFKEDVMEFREEAKKSMEKLNQEEYNKKFQNYQGKWDNRLLENQRMKTLCAELLSQKDKEKQKFKLKNNNHLVELIIQEKQNN